jgi:3-oxoacyl-[acyl-carrier-protein] synthase II
VRRVVITGLGCVSSLACGMEDTWRAMLAGKSGIKPISHIDASNIRTKICGLVSGYNAEDHFSRKDLRKMDPFIQYAMVAADEAIASSGIPLAEIGHDTGVAIGSGIGGIQYIEASHSTAINSNPSRISPFFIPSTIINMSAGYVSIKHGLKGPNISVVTACTTGTHNIGLAARFIASGDATAMVAGGSEHASSILGIGGFAAMKALSTRNDDPEKASRPWDKDRDGFVLSDGAGVLVLEELEFAKARGANILAELVGFKMTGDAYHMTSPDESAGGAIRVMGGAVKDANINLEDIDVINAHGTSTLANDKTETFALKQLFGKHAYNLKVSSVKSMTGHSLGAAGAIEAAASVLTIRDQIVPPTINCDNPDEGLDLDYVRNGAEKHKVNYVMSNSFGFGGTNGSLIFKKFID